MPTETTKKFDKAVSLIQEIFADFERRIELLRILIDKKTIWPIESLNILIRILKSYNSEIAKVKSSFSAAQKQIENFKAEIENNFRKIEELEKPESENQNTKGRRLIERLKDINAKLENEIAESEQKAVKEEEFEQAIEKIRKECFEKFSDWVRQTGVAAHEHKLGIETGEKQNEIEHRLLKKELKKEWEDIKAISEEMEKITEELKRVNKELNSKHEQLSELHLNIHDKRVGKGEKGKLKEDLKKVTKEFKELYERRNKLNKKYKEWINKRSDIKKRGTVKKLEELKKRIQELNPR